MSAEIRSQAEALRRAGRLAEAEATLVVAAPASEVLHDLAQIQYERRKFVACAETLERLIAAAPADTDLATYRLLAKVKAAEGSAADASAVMAAALAANPGRTDFIVAFAETLPPQDAIDTLQSHLDEIRGDPSRMAYVMLRITTLRAPLARRQQNLPRYGLSWPDTYRWPDAQALPALGNVLNAEIAMGSTRATAWLALAHLALASGAWETAERHLLRLRDGSKRTPADFTAFGAKFHAALDVMSDADITGGLVPVHRLTASLVQSGEVIFMASDERYFTNFTLPFLRQLEAFAISLNVHVHLLDGTKTQWVATRDLLAGMNGVRVTLTAEASEAAARGHAYARTYYHAVRYVRFYQELQRSQKPMWILDCDVVVQRDPRQLFASLTGYDLALRSTPTVLDPALKITASCVGISPTLAGLEFARRVAASIIHWKNKNRWSWGVDQTSLFSAFAHMSAAGREPKTLFLDDEAMNDIVGDTGTIRFLSGIEKHLER